MPISVEGDEAEVLARVRAGDRDAYAELVRRHAPTAVRTAALLGAGAEAEDVVQEAFVKAYAGGFAGVVVRHDPSPLPSHAPPPPTAGTMMSLDQARRLVTFEVAVPADLGAPDGVEVSADHRVLSMTWTQSTTGTVRLDQFDGRLDYAFAKSAPGVEFISVSGATALWFDRPHQVVLLGPDGSRWRQTARLGGQTLIWERGTTSLRLEGELSQPQAIAIAESVPPAG